MGKNNLYIIDTNIVSVYMRGKNSILSQHINQHSKHELILPEAVIYEVERGFLYVNAHKQLARFLNDFVPLFEFAPIALQDWRTASRLWALTRQSGKQLSDIDFVIAAITIRLNGVLVTDDRDFEALTIPVENWLI